MRHPPQGECLTAFSAYKEMLGIKAVSWSPSGQLLAVGDFEQARGQRVVWGVVRTECWEWLGISELLTIGVHAVGVYLLTLLLMPPAHAAAGVAFLPAGRHGAQSRDLEPACTVPACAGHHRATHGGRPAPAAACKGCDGAVAVQSWQLC